MKKLLLSFFSLCLLAASLEAQVLSFDPGSPIEGVFESVDLSVTNDLEVHFKVTNNTDDVLDLKWVREVPSICSNAWQSQICDNDLCYFNTVSSNYVPNVGLVDPFTLQANETFDLFILHVFPGVEANCCPYLIHFFDINNWDDTLATVQVNVSVNMPGCDFVISTKEELAAAASIKVYPNPAMDYFSLSENDVIKQITVYNILGKQVKSFNATNSQQYDIAELSSGIYLVGMMNEYGEVLKTVRLFKQTIRP